MYTEFEQRVRQVLANDKNAVDVYSYLAELTSNQDLKRSFLQIHEEEKQHVIRLEKIISIIHEAQR